MSRLYAAATKTVITPPAELIDSLKSSGNPFSAFDGVYKDIYIRLLALSDGNRRMLIVASEGGIPTTDSLLAQLKAAVQVEPQDFIMGDTHNHSCPMARVGGRQPAHLPPMSEEVQALNDQLLAHYHAKVVEAATEVFSRLEPARVGYASGTSYLNVSRDWATPAGTLQGPNYHSYSDKELVVLKLVAESGRLIGLLVNYGMHNNLMFAHRMDGSFNQVCGDIAGEVSEQVEYALGDDCVCGWIVGAAGDQNPMIMGHAFYPRVNEAGVWETMSEPLDYRSSLVLLRQMASIQALEILQTADTITQFADRCEIRSALVEAQIPGVKPQQRGRELLGTGIRKLTFEDGDPVTFRMQLIVLNDIAFAGINCELYARLGRIIKDVLPQNRVFVFSAQCPSVGYMPDVRTRELGGFGTSSTPQKSPWDMEKLVYETYRAMEESAT